MDFCFPEEFAAFLQDKFQKRKKGNKIKHIFTNFRG